MEYEATVPTDPGMKSTVEACMAKYTNNAGVQESPSETCEFHETGVFVANSDDERVNNTRAV